MNFEVIQTAPGSNARRGTLRTLHGTVETPVFMPVATHGAIRGQQLHSVDALGFRVLLANTYHLLLRPGIEHIRSLGGLREFTGWNGGFLTDSGGYQIFSLAKKRTISDEGAAFQSHIDGTKILLTPELSIEAQEAYGSDIMMVLDECVPSTSGIETAREAVRRSTAWALRCLDARNAATGQALFAIVQGALFPELRTESALSLTAHGFDGFAIGGLAVGEGKAEREDMTEISAGLLPADKPRYLMGVGTPSDILEAVHRGVDMFDCVLPTLFGQQGVAFVPGGKIDLRKSEWKASKDPISTDCVCETCRRYSRSYLHHLCRTFDSSVEMLVGLHNLTYYAAFLEAVRTSIKFGRFSDFYAAEKRKADDVRYEIVDRSSEAGHSFASVRHRASGEFMHSSQDPWRESNRLYIEQSRLRERFDRGPLVIWDVGLGAATNAMGAVRCHEAAFGGSDTAPALSLYSFENDLEPLTLAMREVDRFHHLQHPGPASILKKKFWRKGGIHWELLYGDFADSHTAAPLPDLIFFDPFSYKVDGPLWTFEFFNRLYGVLASKSSVGFTFSASTAVRSGLIAAGFYVARGWSTGQKKETTVFMTPSAAAHEPYPLLDDKWLERWKRSGSKMPLSYAGSEALLTEKIFSHPQFCS